MTERLFVLGLIALGLAGVWLSLAWRSRRYKRPGAADLLSPRGSRPLILAFSTADCVPCRTIQKPALEELLQRYPGVLDVRDVDATVAGDLADRFGILTVPSTVVVDRSGRVLAINHGLAGWERLAAQLGLNGAAGPKS